LVNQNINNNNKDDDNDLDEEFESPVAKSITLSNTDALFPLPQLRNDRPMKYAIGLAA